LAISLSILTKSQPNTKASENGRGSVLWDKAKKAATGKEILQFFGDRDERLHPDGEERGNTARSER
jgi:hypothetical protein